MNKRSTPDAAASNAHKSIHLSQMHPVIREVLDSGGTFSLTITGSSMWPTMLGGRDQVTLKKAPERLQVGDLPLYIRRNGQFILHRVVAIGPSGNYTCCGDHQWELETGIEHEQIVGVVQSFTRKKKVCTSDNPRYCRYVRFWIRMLPRRHAIFSVYGFFYRIKAHTVAIAGKLLGRKKAGTAT